MNSEGATIALMGEDVPATHELLRISELNFLPDNPRVYAAVREMADFASLMPAEKQDRIYGQLLQEPSVTKLIPEIRRDGGLQNPIVVRWDTKQVIEGNSRLAAYRKLHEDSPQDARWISIRCLVVDKLTPDQQTRLLGQAHLRGQTDWSPYAKALYCFSWVEEMCKDATSLSNLSGISAAEIKKNVRIIKLMRENGDDRASNFSYYNVIVTNRRISSAVEQNEELKRVLLADVKNKSFTSQAMRDWLPTVIDKPKFLRRYLRRDSTLEDAFDRAKVSDTQQRLKRIRDRLRDIERTDIEALNKGEIRSVKQIVRQIGKDVNRLVKIVEAELED